MDVDVTEGQDPVEGVGAPIPVVLEGIAKRLLAALELDAVAFCLVADDLRVVVGTDDRAAALEAEHQDTEGPVPEATRSGLPVCTRDLTDDARWPEYREMAAVHGLRGCAALPLWVDGENVGALVLHRRHVRDWEPDVLAVAQLIAGTAGDYLAAARSGAHARTSAAQLQHALDSRVVIEQAKGIIAERHQVDVDTAFERLRSDARSAGRRLHDVCSDVVEGGTVLDWSAAS